MITFWVSFFLTSTISHFLSGRGALETARLRCSELANTGIDYKIQFSGIFALEWQVAQLWQRDRASSAILRVWVTLRLNFRLKIYVSRQHLWTVFTQRNFVADFVRLKLNFIKTKKSRFEPPFEGLRGNVRTLSIARWKARGRFFIRHNWTISLSLMVEKL